MDPVSSTNNAGLSYLTQLLSGSGSPLSSSQVQSVLQNASPTDVVQLSDQALQMQEVEGLFGNPQASQTAGLFSNATQPSSSTTLEGILAELTAPSSSTTSNTSTSPSPASLASQMATYQGELQSEQMQTLFGTATTTAASPSPLNLLA